MDDLESLELLSLVSKASSELQNHLGVSDKTLAEFIIAQRLECDSFDAFKARLASVGADFPPSLVESIEKLVLTLHPKFRGKQAAKDAAGAPPPPSGDRAVFKGLAIPDAAAAPNAIDDTLALLEALEPKKKPATNGRLEKGDETARLPGRKRSRSPAGGRGGRGGGDGRKRKYQSRSRSRSRGRGRGPGRKDSFDDDDDASFRRPPPRELDDQPVLFKIYEGHVTGVKDFGAFVNLHGVRGKVDGLVHVSAFGQQRVEHPSDVVSKGQVVKVKVVKIEDNKIGLSMKDADQETGDDLAPQLRIQSGANMEALGSNRGRAGLGFPDQGAAPNGSFQSTVQARQHKKRMTSPERWEIRQMIAAGIAKASDYPDLEEDYNAALKGEGQMDLEQNVDIEIREEEPPFLAGQTRMSLELSPIRVVKAPDGSLNRAAMAGTSLAKERKELRQQEADAKEDDKVDYTTQWQDPMADPGQRKFANDVRRNAQAQAKPDAVPEWRNVVKKDQALGRRTNLTIKEQREQLPIFGFREQLIQAVKENQVLIVVGETGSGKTTQLTQFLAEAGFTNKGIIGCTQPRRVAAQSVAKRVSEEIGCKLGDEVGYWIRFEDVTSARTRIKYMTEGMLQCEILMDPDLNRYSVIMLDEAHERTVVTDVLFALLKKTMKRRPELKVIVTSATLDADKFSEYFNACPIFTIPGRTFPVEILYSKEPETDYLDAALMTVMQIHLSEPMGDILLFLTGQEEIDTSCEILFERMKALGPGVPELLILPVYSALPSEAQSRIFEPAPPGSRKVVIATNIAETSITIDHIFYVIDPGFVKVGAYDPKTHLDSLVVTPISQAQANQRAGRAGRTGPGRAYRLYTEEAYQSEMTPTTIPEIQRSNLSHTILMLKAMGINDLLRFDFMDPPPVNTMLTALEELYALSALDDEGLLTRLGRKMADFPMDPSMAKVLIASVDMGCADEVITIVSMLSVPQVFYRPREKQQQADQKKARFHDPHGDHLTLLNVYRSWRDNGYGNPWCFENFVHARAMRRAKDVREQIVKILERHRQPVRSCGRDTDKVRRALCAGFFRNAARKDPQEGYRTLIEGTSVYIHPSSALFGKQVEWVIYDTLVLTTREYMQCATEIQPTWLVDVAPTFFKVAPSDRLSKRQKNARIQPILSKWEAEDDWRISKQRRGRGGGGGTWG